MDGTDIHEYEPLWGFWTVGELVGQGSFGRVYRCTRSEFDVPIQSAVKIISIPGQPDEILQARVEGMDEESLRKYFKGIVDDLAREILLMHRLKGLTNVVSIEDYQISPYRQGIGWDILIRMEYLTSLNRHTLENRMTQLDVIHLGCDIARAIEQCQQEKVIHRDIKPDNIFISDRGDFKLGDFGIARQLERTQMSMSQKGTVAYMAPEVFNGQPYDVRVDIYSLGLVLYRLLNYNRLPFLPSYPEQISIQQRESAVMSRMKAEDMPPPSLASQELSDIVLKACAFDPDHRYQTPAQLRHALEQLEEKKPQPPVEPPPSLVPVMRTQPEPQPISEMHTGFPVRVDVLPEHKSSEEIPGLDLEHGSPASLEQPAEPVPKQVPEPVQTEITSTQDKPVEDAFEKDTASPPAVMGSTSSLKPEGKNVRKTVESPSIKKAGKSSVRLSSKKRKSSTSRRWLFGIAAACLLVSILCIFFLAPFWQIAPVETMEMPDFIGLDYQVVMDSSEYSFVFEVIKGQKKGMDNGAIYDQYPAASEQVLPNCEVTLTYHYSMADVTIPDVSGMASADATTRLELLDLRVQREYVTDVDFPFDIVITTVPPADTVVSEGSIVTILVSDYLSDSDTKTKCIVPQLISLTYAQAQSVLGRNRLKVGKITFEASTRPKDMVLEQGIPAGTEVEAGSPVDLVLSVGDSKITMPDLVGRFQREAESELLRFGLNIGSITWQANPKPVGMVLTQSVAAFSPVARGTKIDLALSSGETPSTVPSMIGLAHNVALQRLASSNLKEGKVTRETSNNPKDTVIHQGIAANTIVPPGTAIDLVLSNGPGPGSGNVMVPDLAGMSEDEAHSALEACGLYQGATYYGDGSYVRWQKPAAYMMIAVGSAVEIGFGYAYAPNCIGMHISEIHDYLYEKYLVYSITECKNDEIFEVDTIMEQSPYEGGRLDIWGTVYLIYSMGPAPALARIQPDASMSPHRKVSNERHHASSPASRATPMSTLHRTALECLPVNNPCRKHRSVRRHPFPATIYSG